MCVVADAGVLLAPCAVMSGAKLNITARVQLALLTAPCPADMSGVQMPTSLEASISKYQAWGHVRLSSTSRSLQTGQLLHPTLLESTLVV